MKYKVGLTDKGSKTTASKRKGASKSRSSSSSKTFNLSGSKLSRPSTTVRTSPTRTSANVRRKSTVRSQSGKKTPLSGVYRMLGRFSKNDKRNVGINFSPTSKDFWTRKNLKLVLGKAFIFGLSTLFFVGIIVAFVAGIYLQNLQKNLPDPNRLIDWDPDQSTVLYDRNGEELFKIYGDINREFVPLEEIPEYTKWALLAAEDVEFYQHKGVDWKGFSACLIRGLPSYITTGSTEGLCGASTISQQLTRNTIMQEAYGDAAYERDGVIPSGIRKVKEWLTTMQVERAFTKDEILQLYMNEVFLGGVNNGYQAAANAYFGKDVQDLTLAESAILAGIIQSPSQYAPLYGVSQDGTLVRQEYVFKQLEKYQELTGITPEEIDAAREQEIKYESSQIDIEAYHFVFYVKDYLTDIYGAEVVERGGLRVTTTLDLSTQKIAEDEIEKGIATYGVPRGAYNGALVAVDPKTGQILAMVGSVDPYETNDPRIDGSVNIITSERQVGSSFKPYVYFTMFQQYGPYLQTADIDYNFGTYKPGNWDRKYYGFMVAREALVQSRNLPANYTMQLVGIESVLQNVEKMGITTLKNKANYGLALALGAGEMQMLEHAQGFSVFAAEGIRHDVTPILKVENSKGEVLMEYEDTGKRIFDEKDIYLMNWTICDLGNFNDRVALSYYYINGTKVCGKTGTTDGPKDLTTILYHKNLVVGVWAGNNNNVIMSSNAWSTNIPLPIASSFMTRVASKYKPQLYTRPSGILATTVCEDTGLTPGENSTCKKVSSIYVSGRAPALDKRETLEVCTSNKKVPTNAAAASTFGLLSNMYVLNYIPENTNQTASYNKYVSKLKDTLLLTSTPDSAECPLPLGANNAPVISIDSPTSGKQFNSGDTMDISASTASLNGVAKVDYYFGGSYIGTANTAPFGFSYVIPAGTSTGNYNLSATVTDVDGKTGSTSTTVAVKSSYNISISAPLSGTNVSIPQNLQASVSGFTPDKVTFTITGSGYNKSYTDLIGADGWSSLWADVTAANGTYQIIATATSGSLIINSSTITVTLQ